MQTKHNNSLRWQYGRFSLRGLVLVLAATTCLCAFSERSSTSGGGSRQWGNHSSHGGQSGHGFDRGGGKGGGQGRQGLGNRNGGPGSRGFGRGGGMRRPGSGMRGAGGGMRRPRGGRNASAEPPKELVEDPHLRRKEFVSQNGRLNYCEFLENADTRGKTWMVLVFHGMSACGDDNLRQLASPAIKPLLNYVRRKKIKTLVLVPQCPADASWARGGEKPVLDLVDELANAKRREYGVVSERSIATGFSMGAGGCYFLLMKHPGEFTRAIVVGAGGMESWAQKLRGAFYIATGTEDQFSSADNAEALARAIAERGNVVRFEKLAGADHLQSAEKVYGGDCWKWAFSKKPTANSPTKQ